MTEPNARTRLWAELVIEHATRGIVEYEQQVSALEQVFASLLAEMSTLVGEAGVEALQKRALHLARRRAPCVSFTLGPSGYRITHDPLPAGGDVPDDAALLSSAVFLITYNIHLFASFIGEALTHRMLQRTWPQVIDGNTGSGEGDLGT